MGVKQKVYLVWKVNNADYYQSEVDLLAIYSTREAAEKRMASEPPGYEISYSVEEVEVFHE